jgi:hypothetical protein
MGFAWNGATEKVAQDVANGCCNPSMSSEESRVDNGELITKHVSEGSELAGEVCLSALLILSGRKEYVEFCPKECVPVWYLLLPLVAPCW